MYDSWMRHLAVRDLGEPSWAEGVEPQSARQHLFNFLHRSAETVEALIGLKGESDGPRRGVVLDEARAYVTALHELAPLVSTKRPTSTLFHRAVSTFQRDRSVLRLAAGDVVDVDDLEKAMRICTHAVVAAFPLAESVQDDGQVRSA